MGSRPMKKALLWIGVLLALSAAAPALADSQIVPPPGLEQRVTTPPPGGVSVSPDGQITLSSSVCPALAGVTAVPGADYQPGVDIHGTPVAPADLPPSAPSPALDDLPIVVGANLMKHYGGAGGRLFGGGIIGLITVHEGRVYLNGAPLGGNERDMLVAACRAARR